jgi:hypothetical protein
VTLTAATSGHGSTEASAGHGSAKWNGEATVSLISKNRARIVVDASTTHAGKAVVVKVTKAGVDKTVLSSKLDTRGDLVRTISRSKSGANGYVIAKGDVVTITIAGVKVTSTTV